MFRHTWNEVLTDSGSYFQDGLKPPTYCCFSWLGRGGEGANQQKVGQRVWQMVNGLKGKSLGKQDLRCKDTKIDLEPVLVDFCLLTICPKICRHTPASLGWIQKAPRWHHGGWTSQEDCRTEGTRRGSLPNVRLGQGFSCSRMFSTIHNWISKFDGLSFWICSRCFCFFVLNLFKYGKSMAVWGLSDGVGSTRDQRFLPGFFSTLILFFYGYIYNSNSGG